MPPKKSWKNKKKAGQTNKPSKNAKYKKFGKNRDGRTSARLTIERMTSNHAEATPSLAPGAVGSPEALEFGQASTRNLSHGSPWHDPFHSYLFPPTSLNFRPPFDVDGSHLVRNSPGLTEYEGTIVEVLAPMMAPGQEQQQQRNQQPPHQRPPPQHPPSQQRPTTNPNGIIANGEQQQRNQHARDRDTERDSQPRKSNGGPVGHGPMPSHIQVAKPYVFQQAIEGCLKDVGVAQAREDNLRLAGVQWIDNVRRALKLPVRTFDTAVVYYHKFRLVHSDGEYSFVDAAAAALFAACKIEDTLKKSRDILCAAHNLKVPRNEHLSPDDTTFEHHSRSIIGLERLMLEASSFDFRNRHPQTLMIKLAKHYGLGSPKTSLLIKTAYAISLDLYRTFAPLKQSTATLALACLELALRLHNETGSEDEGIQAIINGVEYSHWGITRAEVMETLLDLLELYTNYRTSTTVGPDFPLDTFLETRISLNEELNGAHLPRFTEYVDTGRSGADPAGYAATVNGVNAASSTANGASLATKSDKSPTSPSSAPASGKPNGIRQKAGERGREGTVRFMLNPDRERQERLVVAEYQRLPSLQQQPQHHSQPQSQPHSHPQLQSHPHPHPHQGPGPARGPGHGHGHGNRQHEHNQGPTHRSGPAHRPGSSGRGAGEGAPAGLEDRDRDRDRHRDRESSGNRPPPRR